MGFKYYSKTGKELKTVDWIELQWVRKYTEVGDFTIQVTAKKWNNEIKYIENVEEKSWGIVLKINYDRETEGNFLEIKGLFLEHLLSFGTTTQSWSINETGYDAVLIFLSYFLNHTGMNSTYYIGTDNMTLYKTEINFIDEISTLNMNVPMGTTIEEFFYNWLIPLGYSFYCTPIFSTVTDGTRPFIGVTINIYKLQDKTDSIYFGDYYKNIKNIQYTLDESDMFPHYIVIQEIPIEQLNNFNDAWSDYNDGGELKAYIKEDLYTYTNQPSNFGRCFPTKLYISSANDIEMIATNETLIREQMIQQATLDMLNHYKIETISADMIQNMFYYLQDYDLGDRVTVQIDDIEKQFTVRIAEITEVYNKNKIDISLTLGTPNKVKYKKIY